MSSDLSKEPNLPVGTKDAFHVPVVIAETIERIYPGTKVNFIDNDLTKVIGSNDDEKYHGIANPFLVDPVFSGEKVFILIRPGLVNQVFHRFDLDIEVSEKMQRAYRRLIEAQEEDPGCAGCYDIDENGNVFRW